MFTEAFPETTVIGALQVLPKSELVLTKIAPPDS